MSLTSGQSNWLQSIWPQALATSNVTGVDPTIIAGQAALESGWGSKAGATLFGVKGSGPALTTTEYVDGKPITTSQNFASYGSIEDAFAGYADVLNKYGTGNVSGVANQIANIAGHGYATDPNYASKLGGVANTVSKAVQGFNTAKDVVSSLTDVINGKLKNGVTSAVGSAVNSATGGLAAGVLGIGGESWVDQIKDWIKNSDFFTRVGMAILGFILIMAAFTILAAQSKTVQGAVKTAAKAAV